MATDSKVEEFAEELGRLLGTAEAKAKGWLRQRQQITKTLEGIRDTANNLLAELGTVAAAVQRGRRGRPPGSTSKAAGKRGPGRPKGSAAKKPGRPKGFKMSEEAKAKMREAWARRKAAAGKAGKKK
jgi:hypothetical protein